MNTKIMAGVIESVKFSDRDKTVPIQGAADIFFKNILKTKHSYEFIKIPNKTRREGYIHEHFYQYYNGIKVDGAGYNFHFRNGKMYLAHERYIDVKDINVNPLFTDKEAEEAFSSYKNIPTESVTNFVAKLLINEIPAKDTVLMLVYRTRFFFDHANNTEVGFVDAHTGNKSGTVQFNVSSPSNSIYYLHVYDEVNETPEVQ